MSLSVLHFSSFCLSSVADFSNTEARAPTSVGRTSFLPARRAMRFMYVVWVWVRVIFRWLFLFSYTEATLIDDLIDLLLTSGDQIWRSNPIRRSDLEIWSDGQFDQMISIQITSGDWYLEITSGDYIWRLISGEYLESISWASEVSASGGYLDHLNISRWIKKFD